jgi:tetratricopeptide (TPR) repeat protein
MLAGRRAESLAVAEEALALARLLGADEAIVRAQTVIGGDLAYLGRAEEGLAYFRDAVRLAEEIGDHLGLARAYTNLTDALTMLGRYRESARVAQAGLEAMRRYGIAEALLVANGIEALLAIGEWDEADRLSAGALRRITSSFPYWLLLIRAEVEIGRGELDAARAHLEAARASLPEDHVFGLYDASVAELALWERRWTDADAAVDDALSHAARSGASAPIRLQLCAKGLRVQVELAALARARREAALDGALGRAQALLDAARRAAAAAIAPAATAPAAA